MNAVTEKPCAVTEQDQEWINGLLNKKKRAQSTYWNDYALDKHGRRDPRMFVLIQTQGHLPPRDKAWVYVVTLHNGLTKIGMSTNPLIRARDLKGHLIFIQPVVPKAAKDVETEALRQLGCGIGASECVDCSLSDAIAAVMFAFSVVGRRCHVDPAINPEQARFDQVRLLSESSGVVS